MVISDTVRYHDSYTIAIKFWYDIMRMLHVQSVLCCRNIHEDLSFKPVSPNCPLCYKTGQIADGGSDVDDGRAVVEAAAASVRRRSAAVFHRFS
jgi:hypothetical protein